MSADKHKKKDHRDRGSFFTIGVEKRPDVKKPEKRRTRLCVDCSTTILDDDGEIKVHYGTFIEVQDKGRRKERCDDCEDEHRKKYHKGYQRKRRVEARKKKPKKTPPMRDPDCPQYDECLTEAAIADNKDFTCESCETYLANHPVNKNR